MDPTTDHGTQTWRQGTDFSLRLPAAVCLREVIDSQLIRHRRWWSGSEVPRGRSIPVDQLQVHCEAFVSPLPYREALLVPVSANKPRKFLYVLQMNGVGDKCRLFASRRHGMQAASGGFKRN